MIFGRICLSVAAAAAMVTAGLLYRGYDGWTRSGESAEHSLSNAAQSETNFTLGEHPHLPDVNIDEENCKSPVSSSDDVIDSVEVLDAGSDLYMDEGYWFSHSDSTPSFCQFSENGSDYEGRLMPQPAVGVPSVVAASAPAESAVSAATVEHKTDVPTPSERNLIPLRARRRNFKPLKVHIPQPDARFSGESVNEAANGDTVPQHEKPQGSSFDFGDMMDSVQRYPRTIVKGGAPWRPRYASLVKSKSDDVVLPSEKSSHRLGDLESSGWDTLADLTSVLPSKESKDASVPPSAGNQSRYGGISQGSTAGPSRVSSDNDRTKLPYDPVFDAYSEGVCVYDVAPGDGDAINTEGAPDVDPGSLAVLESEIDEMGLNVSELRCKVESLLMRHTGKFYGDHKMAQFTLRRAVNVLRQLETQLALSVAIGLENETETMSKQSTGS
ncbi:surE, putative [Babesia ovata]|uniref:SurE, putative n=1 Tax=Babesia ovata TaxID=189622 RepID=A0A2H6KEA3_9APIC|nr:surE, putative [Babesia ovata]GBE61330.1 surE, putative [Babesia ovata]